VPPKIVQKVGFHERDFEGDHLAEKSNRTKMGPKIHGAWGFLHGLWKLDLLGDDQKKIHPESILQEHTSC
jgi:hypothetical protein